jgi:hypothetical protein
VENSEFANSDRAPGKYQKVLDEICEMLDGTKSEELPPTFSKKKE